MEVRLDLPGVQWGVMQLELDGQDVMLHVPQVSGEPHAELLIGETLRTIMSGISNVHRQSMLDHAAISAWRILQQPSQSQGYEQYEKEKAHLGHILTSYRRGGRIIPADRDTPLFDQEIPREEYETPEYIRIHRPDWWEEPEPVKQEPLKEEPVVTESPPPVVDEVPVAQEPRDWGPKKDSDEVKKDLRWPERLGLGRGIAPTGHEISEPPAPAPQPVQQTIPSPAVNPYAQLPVEPVPVEAPPPSILDESDLSLGAIYTALQRPLPEDPRQVLDILSEALRTKPWLEPSEGTGFSVIIKPEGARYSLRFVRDRSGRWEPEELQTINNLGIQWGALRINPTFMAVPELQLNEVINDLRTLGIVTHHV